jgi:hypothetical protein
MKPRFGPRAAPLAARAVVALAGAARALGLRLCEAPDETLRALAVLSGDGFLIAVGPEALLPWVDGAIYLGSDAAAPALLMPTTLAPDVHPQLLEKALRGLKGLKHGQLAIVPEGEGHTVVSLAQAATAGRAGLKAWLGPAP